MFGCESNNFVGSAGNHREQCDPHSKASPESGHGNQRVYQDRNQHDRHQETGAAARMIRGVFLDRGRVEGITVLEGENCLVLRAVIFVYAMNVSPQRDSPNKQQEKSDADGAIHEVEDNLLAEERIDAFQFGGSQQRKELIHENKKPEGEDNVDGSHPATDFEFLAFVVCGYFVEGDIGRETEGTESECHGVP